MEMLLSTKESQQSPFKFLDSYEKEDKDKFFGRDKVVDELYERIFETKLMLLYGASGVGKTSIIRCGLANRFNPPQWMDLFVRKRQNINDTLYNTVADKIREAKPDAEIPEDILEALQMLYLYNFIPVYLIFDQFEELFIFGGEEEQRDFFHFVERILKSDLPVKILLSMREEYIAFLSDFERQVPSLFEHRIRVEKMVRTNLTEVIEGTAKAYGIGLLEPEKTADAIIDNINDKKGVDLTNLQVYLDRLYRTDRQRNPEAPMVQFDPELVKQVGELKDVLGDFLDEQLGILEGELGKEQIPLDVLFSLVTDDGTKRAQLPATIESSLERRKSYQAKDVQYCIRRFIEMRIFKDLEDGNVELSHDSLAAKIYDKVSVEDKTLRRVEKFIADRYLFYQNRDVLLTKDDVDYINPYLSKVDISPDQREFIRKSIAALTRRRRLLLTLATAVFLAISGLAVYSLFQRNAAVEQAAIALQNAERAEKNAEQARLNAEEAEAQRQIAIAKQQEAEQQTLIAQNAQNLAEERRLEALKTAAAERLAKAKAIEATNAANTARAVAEDAKDAEASQRARADSARAIAEQKEREAQQLLIVSVAQSLAARSLQLDEAPLKAKVAQQAYNFNEDAKGNPYDRTIYEGLYYAVKALEGERFNQLNGHRSSVQEMAFTANRKQLFSTSSDGNLYRWDWTDDIVDGTRSPIEVNRVIKRSLAISPDGNTMVAGRDAAPHLQLYDLQSGAAPQTIDGFDASVLEIVFLPDGSGFLALTADQKIQRYDLASQSLSLVAEHESPLRSIVLRPDGEEIAGISMDGKLLFWNINGQLDPDPQIIVPSSSRSLYSITYNHKGDRFAVGDVNGVVWVWNPSNNELIAQLRGHSARISDLAFSDDDDYLATASYDGSVQMWVVGEDNYDKRLPIILRDHNSWVMSLAFSPDGENLLTGGRDGQIKIWPTKTEKLAADVCGRLDQNFTQKEWDLYVGAELDRVRTCEDLPLPN
ncbi:MAG: hypothetical protein AAF927_27170 [Bacteroidota bacterium]